MESPELEGRKEDYYFRATITFGDSQIDDLHCKAYLPIKFTEPVLLYFHLTDKQAQLIRTSRGDLWKFSLRGELGWGDQKTRIEADNVYIKRIRSRNWGDISERLLIAEPVDLRTIIALDRDSSDERCKPGGNFQLSPNRLLNPAMIIENSYDGNKTVETLRPLEFTLANGLTVTFKKHFKTRENADGEYLTASHLVAEFDLDTSPVSRVDASVTRCLDDFLLIASFASRGRCVWCGWETFDSDSHTKFYRKDVAIPDHPTREDVDDGLISKAEFGEFLKIAYFAFINEEHKDLLRQALSYAIPREFQTVEAIFIRLYSALETLVLHFRRKNNLETVFSTEEEDDWSQFRNDLKRWIKEESVLKGAQNKTKQRWICGNLSALKRIAFSTAFSKFLKSYNVSLEDLWQVNNNKAAGWSLSEIRNELVHGESLSEPKLDSLMAAEKHLQWTVERLILAVLGWDISRSNVSSVVLENNLFYRNWEIDRRIITG